MAQGLLSGSFRVGLQIAAPFIVYGITFYVGVGLLTRLMPRLPIFFVVMPLQITASLIILAIVLSSSMIWFINYFEGRMAALLLVG
jgi:flagellar biosynthetic protein FliR